jgi:predicted signal transduction protein with EAL and GGDEF domain
MSASIGIATYPEDATGIEELIRRADMAMYEAKAAGRNMFRRFRAGAILRAPRRGAAAIGAAAPVPAPNWSAANA